MQDYELRCRKLTGEYVAEKLGEFSDLLDALESVTGDIPPPRDCSAWAVMSEDGLEMAAKRG